VVWSVPPVVSHVMENVVDDTSDVSHLQLKWVCSPSCVWGGQVLVNHAYIQLQYIAQTFSNWTCVILRSINRFNRIKNIKKKLIENVNVWHWNYYFSFNIGWLAMIASLTTESFSPKWPNLYHKNHNLSTKPLQII